jgi:hypothetical protein
MVYINEQLTKAERFRIYSSSTEMFISLSVPSFLLTTRLESMETIRGFIEKFQLVKLEITCNMLYNFWQNL